MKLILILALAVLLTACGPERTIEERTPAASAGISRELAMVWARRVASDISGIVVTFTPTGSMLPVLDSRAVGAAERLDAGEILNVGDIVVFENGKDYIVHRVVEVHSSGDILTSGDNARSDGWISRKLVRFRLVAIFYTLR